MKKCNDFNDLAHFYCLEDFSKHITKQSNLENPCFAAIFTGMENEKPKRPVGRPAKVPYKPSIGQEVMDLMAAGHDVVDVCEILGIPRSTFYDWQDEHEEFRTFVLRGREALADFDAKRIRDEINMIDTKDGAIIGKVKINALQWFAERRNPKLYGTKVQTELTGKNGGAIEIKARVINAEDLGDEALDAVEAALLAAKDASEGK